MNGLGAFFGKIGKRERENKNSFSLITSNTNKIKRNRGESVNKTGT